MFLESKLKILDYLLLSMKDIDYFLKAYLRERPLFLSLIRAKEAYLYQKFLPLKNPILDVGCGDGMFAKIVFANKIKNQKSKIKNNKEFIIDIGLDLKNSRMEEARKLGVYRKLVVYDGRKIPYPNNYFATIISNCVLEHITNLDLTIEEIYRVLKPGGLFLTTVMSKPWEENLFGTYLLGNLYKKMMRDKQVHLNLLSVNMWRKMFQKRGFSLIEESGYLNSRACRWIDICHYLSIPSLLSYKLFGKWVLFPQFIESIYPIQYLTKIVLRNVEPEKSVALFYVFQK